MYMCLCMRMYICARWRGRIAELFGTVTSEKDLLGKVHLSFKHCIRKEGGGCATANSVGPAVDVPQSLGAWSNIFQAYRASAKAVKWRGNESVVGLHRTSWKPLGTRRINRSTCTGCPRCAHTQVLPLLEARWIACDIVVCSTPVFVELAVTA